MAEEVQNNGIESQGISKFYYSIADFNILLEPGIKTEIIEKQDVFPIPHAPVWCQGMISLRGKLIPVVNLHKLLNDAEQIKSNWLLILEKEPYPQLAIRIDKLPQQQILNEPDKNIVNSEQLPKWLKAILSIDDKILYEADHTELFDQIIQENETSSINANEPSPISNPDSSGNDS
jgi:chemotaxis signal transduction protein